MRSMTEGAAASDIAFGCAPLHHFVVPLPR